MSLSVILPYTPQIIYAFSKFLEHTRDIKWGAGIDNQVCLRRGYWN